MNQQQAKESMRDGNKVTHRLFGEEEFMQIVDGKLLSEDGVQHSWVDFWELRTEAHWQTDWKVFE